MKKKKTMTSFFAFVAVAVIVIIGYFIYRKQSENYNYLKVDSSKNLVYTSAKIQHGTYYQFIPYLNIKGDIGIYLNSDIQDFVKNFDQDHVGISYESDLNGKVLSLVIVVEDHSFVESATILNYRSYNIHLGNQEVLSDDVLLSYFDLSKNDVELLMNQKLNGLYQQTLQEGLIDRTCNYQCFLKTRNFTNGIEDVYYFVRDGKLIAFKPYTYLYSNAVDQNIVYDFELTN